MQPNQTTAVKTRKQVLVPPGKPVAKDDAFITPRGANIEIQFDNTGLYFIVFSDGGPVPKELKSKFTDRTLAEQAIEKYLSEYWKSRS